MYHWLMVVSSFHDRVAVLLEMAVDVKPAGALTADQAGTVMMNSATNKTKALIFILFSNSFLLSRD
jgi:hypothetical protein